MNVSSGAKAGFYPTPEFKNIVQSLRELKREVKNLGSTPPDPAGIDRLVRNVDSLEESLREHYRELSAVEGALEVASERRLTEKQRAMLRVVSTVQDDTIYTSLIDKVSEEMSIPRSTVRWSLKGLRDSGLIYAGDRDNKGVPVRLTEAGRVMAGLIGH